MDFAGHGEGVVTVHVTAGQSKKGLAYAEDRHKLVMYAYQVASAATAWNCGTIVIADHLAEHCQALGTAAPVSLGFGLARRKGLSGDSRQSIEFVVGWAASVVTVARNAPGDIPKMMSLQYWPGAYGKLSLIKSTH